jgi:transposase
MQSLEAGKKRLAGNMARGATGGEFKDLCPEARDMKVLAADLTLKSRLLKKASLRMGETTNDIPRL